MYRQQIQQQACASPAWRLRTKRRWRWQLCWLPPFALPSTTVNTAAAAAAVNAAVVVFVLLAMSRSFERFVDYLPWVSGPLCLSFSLVFAAIYVFSRKLIFRLVAAWPDSSSLAFGLCDILVRRLLLASVISVSASPAQPPRTRHLDTHTHTDTETQRDTDTNAAQIEFV